MGLLLRIFVIFLFLHVQTLLLEPLFCFAQAQTMSFTPAPLPEETSFGVITGIIQDKQGFIWISANTGLYRFDGYRWVNYLNFDNRSECVLGCV